MDFFEKLKIVNFSINYNYSSGCTFFFWRNFTPALKSSLSLIQKWKNAIGKTQKTVKSPSFFWFQMTAAVMVGVVLGGLLFGNLNLGTSEKNQEIAFEDATIEVVYTKL